MDLTFKRLSTTPCALGESPVWDATRNWLWWIDGVAGVIHRLVWPADGNHALARWHIGGHIGAIALAEGGGLVVARDHGFFLFNPATGTTTTVLELEGADPAMRLNDAKLDRQGRLICVGMGRATDPIGMMHQLSGQGVYCNWGGALRIGNGVCFSPAGDTLYFSDTVAKLVFACAYDSETGDISAPRLHVDTSAFGSGVDGATVDRDGNMWATFIHTGEIACLSPSGQLLDRFPAPFDLPSSLAFGGQEMTTLFATSIQDSGTGRAVSRHPDGGHLFAIEGTGATGIAEAYFAVADKTA